MFYYQFYCNDNRDVGSHKNIMKVLYVDMSLHNTGYFLFIRV